MITSILQKKRGEVCFIGATGTTINDLPDSANDFIKKNTLIGINGWLLHKLIPDIYITECFGIDRAGMDDVKAIKAALMFKKIELAKTPIVLKDTNTADFPYNFFPYELIKNIIRFESRLIDGGCRKTIVRSLLKRKPRLKSDFLNHVLHSRRGTAVASIILAYLMEFKEIVLLGVDMEHGRHFYDSMSGIYEEKHLCEDEKIGCPISQVILGVNEALLLPDGIKLSAFRPSRLFNKEIPDFWGF